MRYIAAYLLAVLGGNEAPTADDIKKILTSVGIEIDSARLDKVIAELSGKSVDDIIASGSKKLASFAGGSASGPSAQPSAAGEAASSEAAKKEEVVEEDVDLECTGMFGDDDY